MQPKTPGLLWDMRKAAEFIQRRIAGHTFDEFIGDEVLQTMAERKLEIIGETARRLLDHDPDTAQRLTGLRQMISMRNVLAHQYDQIDYEKIWIAIQTSLPTLLSQLADVSEEK